VSPAPPVRAARPEDALEWSRLRTALWPDSPLDHPPEIAAYFADPPEHAVCLVAADADGHLMGFAEFGLRDYAEECRTSPVGYLEGIYVEPDARAGGVGRALVAAGEDWARQRGCREMASDRALDNDASGAFHEAIGFAEAGRIVCYRKELT
jgi:aminoglycoside 6'-N-acetyltransferase I